MSFCEEASVSFNFLISLKDKKAIFPNKEMETLVQFLGVHVHVHVRTARSLMKFHEERKSNFMTIKHTCQQRGFVLT